MVPDGMDGRTDARTHGRRQNYIPPTSSGDKNTGSIGAEKSVTEILIGEKEK